MSLAGAAAMQSLMGTKFLHMLGNADIIERLFKPALQGEKIGALCMTEPNAGSDLEGIATTAKKVDGGYVLNGQKTWITAAPVADFFTVFARAGEEKKLTIFLVERSFKGLVVGREIHKMGVWALPTSEVALADCFVPDSHRLSKEEGDGEAHLRKTLAEIRIITGAMALGVARAALDESGALRRPSASSSASRSTASRRSSSSSPRWPPSWRRPSTSSTTPPGCTAPAGRTTRKRRWPSSFATEAAARICDQAARVLAQLRLRDGIPGAALPARRPLHPDRRRHQRDPQADHRQGGVMREQTTDASGCCWPSPGWTATTRAPRWWCAR